MALLLTLKRISVSCLKCSLAFCRIPSSIFIDYVFWWKINSLNLFAVFCRKSDVLSQTKCRTTSTTTCAHHHIILLSVDCKYIGNLYSSAPPSTFVALGWFLGFWGERCHRCQTWHAKKPWMHSNMGWIKGILTSCCIWECLSFGFSALTLSLSTSKKDM